MICTILRRVGRLAAGTAIVASIASCATGGGGSATAGPRAGAGNPNPDAAPTRSTASYLIADDLRKTNALTLHDAIDRLRPQWLRRGTGSAANTTGLSRLPAEPFVVWIDNVRAGGPEVLDQVQITRVRWVQYFSPSEAESRFGTGYSSGAIQIITTASAKP
jgi:hypothetical protein